MSAAQVLTGSGVLSAAGSPWIHQPQGMSVVGMSQPAQPMAGLKLEFILTRIPSGAAVLQQPQSLLGRGRGVCV